MRTRTGNKLGQLALIGALGLGSSGCIKAMLLDGQIQSTRQASAAVDTLSDYEVANSVAFAGVAQFEGMHYLAPENEDALFMLTKSWTGIGFGFIEDQMEQAEDAEGTESPLYLYHQARARAAYERAIHYGIELLEMKNDGFDAAKKNNDTIREWLAGFNDAENDVPALFWTGQAWMAKTNILKEEPATVAELFVGVAMVERAVQLDENYLYGSGHTVLGAYHARSAMAELEESKKHFEKAIAISQGKALLAKFQFAAKYYCTKSDKQGYEKLLNEVIEAGDVFPEQRLTNTIAKRRAKRYMSKQRQGNCGF
jgi:tetratricopeptide (TPR) repeat protein